MPDPPSFRTSAALGSLPGGPRICAGGAGVCALDSLAAPSPKPLEDSATDLGSSSSTGSLGASMSELSESGLLESGAPIVWGQVDGARMRRLFDEQFAFVWRYLRRLGLEPSDADDAAQKVFVVLARKLAAVVEGKERAFLCATAFRVVSDHRRTLARRAEIASAELDASWRPPLSDSYSGAESSLDRRRARAVLDEVLDALPLDLRSVFVLFELEELGTADIAAMLEIPEGTVASRLRRAREKFRCAVKRLQVRDGMLRGGA